MDLQWFPPFLFDFIFYAKLSPLTRRGDAAEEFSSRLYFIVTACGYAISLRIWRMATRLGESEGSSTRGLPMES
ncbi:MAG: hypothetical protein COS88_05395 [Chloroflexi bacterium CG07_land_8_20_14_0_80_51_10]|nr:MAG: hypothetical protein COS88_05395 [Chloroflexi bacterium CG07_land_8_20_14_0_80_51_10]